VGIPVDGGNGRPADDAPADGSDSSPAEDAEAEDDEAADDEALGYALVEGIAEDSTTISAAEAHRLVKIARLYHLNCMDPLPPTPAAIARTKNLAEYQRIITLDREDMTVKGAPRGVVVSDGGGRPSLLRRRSGGVKLEAAGATGWW